MVGFFATGDPGFSDAERTLRRRLFLQQYGALLRDWRLPTATLNALIDAWVDPNNPPVPSDAAVDVGYDGGRTAALPDLSGTLTTSQQAELHRYAATLSERQQLEPLRAEWELAQFPLTRVQHEQLIDRLHRIYRDMPPPSLDLASGHPQAALAVAAEHARAVAERFRSEAAVILDTEQLAWLDRNRLHEQVNSPFSTVTPSPSERR
jgi:hypothetical protein